MAKMCETLLRRSSVRIKSKENVIQKLDALTNGGSNELRIISDFDYTLTKYLDSDGQKCWIIHELFTNLAGKRLGDELLAVCAKYVTIENDQNMTNEQKSPYMEQWWSETHDMISKENLHWPQARKFVQGSKIFLRDKACDILHLCERKNIPFILFSAGITDFIQLYIKESYGKLPENLHIISNKMKFDENEAIVGFKLPTIHTFNKNSSVIEENDFLDGLSEKNNVLVLGDSLGDIHMDFGVKNEGNVLKMGFLNLNFEKLLPLYLQAYDIVLLNDQTLEVPLEILKRICSEQK